MVYFGPLDTEEEGQAQGPSGEKKEENTTHPVGQED
jgi:hypothetical protein